MPLLPPVCCRPGSLAHLSRQVHLSPLQISREMRRASGLALSFPKFRCAAIQPHMPGQPKFYAGPPDPAFLRRSVSPGGATSGGEYGHLCTSTITQKVNVITSTITCQMYEYWCKYNYAVTVIEYEYYVTVEINHDYNHDYFQPQ